MGAQVQPTQTSCQAAGLAYYNKKEFLDGQYDRSCIAYSQGLKNLFLKDKWESFASEGMEYPSSSCREHVLFEVVFTGLGMEYVPHLESCHPCLTR